MVKIDLMLNPYLFLPGGGFGTALTGGGSFQDLAIVIDCFAVLVVEHVAQAGPAACLRGMAARSDQAMTRQ